MPIISEIQGIKIYMNFGDGEHNPPHIHGFYGGHDCAIGLDGKVLNKGKMKEKEIKIIVNFVVQNSSKLHEMWETQKFERI